jgi:uncharacterized Fe-S cluster protein YjdI
MKAEIKKLANGKTYAVEEYASVQELVAANRARKKVRGDSDAFTRKNDSWIGVKSYEEAEEHALGGWVGEIDAVKALTGKENRKVESKRITSRNDMVGFAPIVPLAIIGVPQSMLNVAYKPMKGKVIDLYYDITMLSGTAKETIAKSGSKVMGAAVALEKRGYRVRLSAVQAYCGSMDKNSKPVADMLVLRVKSENQPLEIKRCMFPMTHPAMFRSIGFGWYERFPLGTDRWGYGRTLSSELKGEATKVFEELFGKQATYLSGTTVEKLESSDAVAEYIMKGGK